MRIIQSTSTLSLPQLTGSGKEPVEVTLLYPSKWIVTKYPGTSRHQSHTCTFQSKCNQGRSANRAQRLKWWNLALYGNTAWHDRRGRVNLLDNWATTQARGFAGTAVVVITSGSNTDTFAQAVSSGTPLAAFAGACS